MFTRFLALVAALAIVRADPTPQTPDGIQKVGGDCTVTWTADPSGTWKTMHIELMAGSNLGMEHLTTVATVDGTDASNNTFKYPCPGVTPNAPIFFYQFTSPFAPLSATTWTTRFTIADASGSIVAAPNATQPGGQAIPWGNAALTDPSTAVAAPSDAGTQASGAASGSASASGSGSGSVSASGAGASASTGASVTAGGASASASAPAGSLSQPASASGTQAVPSGMSTKAAGSAGSKPVNGTSTNPSSAGASTATSGAVSIRGAPLYALGGVAAFVVYAL